MDWIGCQKMQNNQSRYAPIDAGIKTALASDWEEDSWAAK